MQKKENQLLERFIRASHEYLKVVREIRRK